MIKYSFDKKLKIRPFHSFKYCSCPSKKEKYCSCSFVIKEYIVQAVVLFLI